MKLTKAAIEKRAAELGWSVTWCTQQNDATKRTEKYVEFEGDSPAGEDLLFIEFYRSLSDISDLLMERYNDFDPEQHAVEWYGANNGEPSSIRELLDDADAIGEMIRKLAYALSV